MRAFVCTTLLLTTACSTDVVQVLSRDASVPDSAGFDASLDAGAPLDAGIPDSGPRVFECPGDDLRVMSRHALSDVATDRPIDIDANTQKVFVGHVQASSGDLAYVAVQRGGSTASFGVATIDGPVQYGPFVSSIRDDGFLVANVVDVAGEATVTTDVFITDDPPVRRSFEWFDRYRLQGAVAQRDDMILTGTSTDGTLLYASLSYSGASVGFGIRETFVQPVQIAKYANNSRGQWMYTLEPDWLNPNRLTILVASFNRNGSANGFKAVSGCTAAPVDFDGAVVDVDRSFLVEDCGIGSYVEFATFAVGETNRGASLSGRVRAASRIDYDGTIAYVLRWGSGDEQPLLRLYDRVGEDVGEPRVVPFEVVTSAPVAIDITAVAEDEGIATVGAVVVYEDGSGELLVMEGCGKR